MVFILFITLPAFYIFSIGYLFYKKNRAGLGYSLLFAGITGAIAVWGIFQSRSSTAAIGLLFVPMYAAISGAFTLGFFQLKSKPGRQYKLLSWICLIGALCSAGYVTYTSIQIKQTELAKTEFEKNTKIHLQWILETGKANDNNNLTWLHQELEKRNSDDSFKMAIARSEIADSLILDKVSDSKNIHLLSAVAANKRTSSRTIVSIENGLGSSGRIDFAIAMNDNSPADLLEKIYKRSSYVGHLLAKNVNTPHSIRLKIAQSTDTYILEAVANSIHSNCAVLSEAKNSLSSPKLNDFENKRNKIETELNQRIETTCLKK